MFILKAFITGSGLSGKEGTAKMSQRRNEKHLLHHRAFWEPQIIEKEGG